MRGLKPLWGILLALAVPAAVCASPETSTNLRFNRYSLEQGLSQGTIHCIEQDSDGFLWVGTKDGLNRFDGFRFVAFHSDPFDTTGLSDDDVTSLHADRQGNLWIGTARGLNLLPPGRGAIRRFTAGGRGIGGLADDAILCLHRDRKGILWAGTETGLVRLDPNTGELVRYRHDETADDTISDDRITDLCEDSAGNLWVGTRNGLNRLVRSTGSFERFVLDPGSEAAGANAVSAIVEASDGTIWLSAQAGLWRMDGTEGAPRRVHFSIPSGRRGGYSDYGTWITDLLVDTSERLWIGTPDGVILLSTADGTAALLPHVHGDVHSLSDESITRLFQDDNEVVWVGTNGYGLNSWSPYLKKFERYAYDASGTNGLSFDSVRAIYEDPTGAVWIGGYGGGLNRLDPATGRFSHTADAPGGTIYSILGDPDSPDEVLWIGTEGEGLFRYERASRTFRPYVARSSKGRSLLGKRIYAMCADRTGRLLVGTERGAFALDRGKGEVSVLDCWPGTGSVRAIATDCRGGIWVGGAGGLACLDPESGQAARYAHNTSDPSSLSADEVLCIHEDASGTIWVGTNGGGLCKLDAPSNTFTHYLQGDGLPNNVVYGILEDDEGALWLSTNAGISRFDPTSESFCNFTPEDGLQSLEFNANAYHKGRSGSLYFGGVSGFNVIRPGCIRYDPHPPTAAITSFITPGGPVAASGTASGRNFLKRPICVADRLELSHRDRTISFEFAALNLASPAENRFAYKLKGFEDRWIDIGNRHFVTFTDLEPGEYRLLVKAANSDGVWSARPTSLAISISPPMWATSWARSLGIVALGALVFGLHRARTNSYRRRGAELARSREFLNSIINAIHDPVFVKDERRRWIVLNDKACEMMGRAREDLLLKTDYDVFPEDRADKYRKEDDEAFETGETVVNVDVIDWQGAPRTVSTKRSAFTERATGKRFIAGAIRDITELKRYEKAMEERLRFESLVSKISARLINPPVSDIDRVIEGGLAEIGEFFSAERIVIRLAKADRDLPANVYAWRASGASRSQASQDFETSFPNLAEELRRDSAVVFKKAEDIPTAWTPEREHLARTGISSGVVVPLSVGGSLLGSISVLTVGAEREWEENTTSRVKILGEILANALNRKRAVEALQQSQEKYWTILENIGIGIALIGKNMTVLEVNKKMREWFPEAGEREIPFCENPDRPPGGPHKCEQCPIMKTLEDGRTHDVPLTRRHEGRLASFRIVTSPIRSSAGEVVAAIALVEDITEKEQLEEQLRHAQKMEAIGTLAGGIAHDFNNILCALLGYASLAIDEAPEDGRVRDHLGQIEAAGRRAAELVEQILSFSRRAESGVKPLRLQPVVDETLKLLHGSLPATVEIKQDISDDCGPVLSNPSHIHQVVMNLCTNAFHATPGGKGSIELSLSEVEADVELASKIHDLKAGRYARLTVRDYGTGIEPEVLKRIFEPYFTTKGPGQGSGLGLATVHGIVKRLGGAIHVESKPGAGATFYVYLPICDMPQDETGDVPALASPASLQASVLFVDDEPAIANMSENILRKLGHRVKAFTDSVEALEAFRAEPDEFNLIITDVTMPKLTGLELADEVRAVRKDIPIVLCTGYSDSVDSNSLKELKIRKCIWKPIVTQDLANMIQEVLSAPEAVEA